MKRVARKGEDKPVLGIPVVVRVRIVAVKPPLITVVVDLEDVRVAVGVGPFRTRSHLRHCPSNTLRAV